MTKCSLKLHFFSKLDALEPEFSQVQQTGKHTFQYLRNAVNAKLW